MSRSHNPGRASTTGLACSPFAHRYSGNRGCFLFLRVLRCFSSPGWLPLARITELALRWVAPFGHPGITACVRLPRAYRSLPRPSSPSRAKASTVRLFALDLKSSSYFLSRCDSSNTTSPCVSCQRAKLDESGNLCGRHQRSFRRRPCGQGLLDTPERR
jgi:hypothetical protein